VSFQIFPHHIFLALAIILFVIFVVWRKITLAKLAEVYNQKQKLLNENDDPPISYSFKIIVDKKRDK